jgi:hypothetical protein
LFDAPKIVIFSGLAVWLPVAVLLVLIVQAMVADDMDTLFGIVCAYTVICLGFFTVRPPHPYWAPVFCATAYITMFMGGAVRTSWNRLQHHQIDVDQLERMCEVLRERGPNPGVEFRIAEALIAKGETSLGMDVALRAMPQLAGSLFPEEQRAFVKWQQARLQPSGKPLPCRKCQRVNDPGAPICAACRHSLIPELIGGVLSPTSPTMRLLGAWMLMLSFLVAIALAQSLPPLLAAIAILVLLVLAAVVAARALRVVTS